MAGEGLNKTILTTGIKKLFKEMRSIEDNTEAEDKYAKELADIIEEYVKSGKVVTTGSATNQVGMIT